MGLAFRSFEMAQVTWSVLVVLFFRVLDALGKSTDLVTCGSVIKLYNSKTDARLHSHDVKYGSGSGQQSVTGVDDVDDNNSHWALRGLMDQLCQRGQPFKCGDIVRFEHVSETGSNTNTIESTWQHCCLDSKQRLAADKF